jgi:hypothetical protein
MDPQFSSEVFRVAGRPNRTGLSDCQLSAAILKLDPAKRSKRRNRGASQRHTQYHPRQHIT